MLFAHNNRYLLLTSLLTLLQPALRDIFETFKKYFTKYFMKYLNFTPKHFMKFYITSCSTSTKGCFRRISSGGQCQTDGLQFSDDKS